MQQEPLYLFNPPENVRDNNPEALKEKNLDAIFNRPLTGEDIAYKVMKAQSLGENPNLTIEEFRLYEPWKAKQEFDFWGAAADAGTMLVGDAAKAAVSMAPVPKSLGGVGVAEGVLNATTRLPATLVEAFGRGFRGFGGMFKLAAQHPNSPFLRLLSPNQDEYTRYQDFNSLAEFNARSARIAMGKENVWTPDPENNESKLLGEDASKLTPQYLLGANQALAEAGSYVLDPTTLLTFGGSIPLVAGAKAAVKAGLKGAFSRVGDKIISAGMKEGISSTASAFKNAFAKMDFAKSVGAVTMEKTGSAFKWAGERITKPVERIYEGFKNIANDYLDINLHNTGTGAVRTTGAISGQAGFGGQFLLAAGAGMTIWQVPYASIALPIWGAAHLAKIGGNFLETVGKEMAQGAGALGRVAKLPNSTGKAAQVLAKWSPLKDYVWELAKTTAKAGAWGTTIGYLSSGEEGAAGGLGTGMAIGVGGYHLGLAHNMFAGNSKQQMSVRLASHLDELKAGGFTQHADNLSAYLNDIRVQHGENKFYQTLGAYIRLADSPDNTVSILGTDDFKRMADDPAIDPSVRESFLKAFEANTLIREGQARGETVIGGGSWNGMFEPRRGKTQTNKGGVPYLIIDGIKSPEGVAKNQLKQGKTHVFINKDAIANSKIQATGLRGELYHVLMDVYDQVYSKRKGIDESTEGLHRMFGLNLDADGRKSFGGYLREVVSNLWKLNEDKNTKFQRNRPVERTMGVREKGLFKIAQENAPAGWSVRLADEYKGKVPHTVKDGNVTRPAFWWTNETVTGKDLKNRRDIFETKDGKYQILGGDKETTTHDSLAEAFDVWNKEIETDRRTPPNVSGEKTNVGPEPTQEAIPDPRLDPNVLSDAEYKERFFKALDTYEKDGTIDPVLFNAIEELGESAWNAHVESKPFDYIFLGGDLGFARNLIDEIKHRFSKMADKEGRQHGFVPDFSKSFAEWFFDKDGKPVTDPYLRKIFDRFLKTHKNYSDKLNGFTVDVPNLSAAHLKQFVEENNLQEEYDRTQDGAYVKKSDEDINKAYHVKYQAAVNDLIEMEKAGIDTGFNFYAVDKTTPEIRSLDEESADGTMYQQGWEQYRTTAGDIQEAQRKGTIPSKEEMQEQLKKKVWGKRGRPRTGEIDELVAKGRNGSIVFTGVPTMEAFKVLQKHLPKAHMGFLAQIAPAVLDGGTTMNNIFRIKYAGFQTAPEVGPALKRPKAQWAAVEKNMVFFEMQLRATLRNPKSGTYDYKNPHAAFMLRGVDVDVLQRRILWMWKNEPETRKRWANHTEFEKDVYRLIENYSMKNAIGGTRFFGGGDIGKSKKRLAAAAIGAFPTKEMLGMDVEDGEYTIPEIDWHHYQLKSYGQGNAGRDIPWTNIRLDAVKSVHDAEGMMRMPYAERAYFRTQELFQKAENYTPREGEDTPAVVRVVSQEGLQIDKALKDAKSRYSPTATIRDIVNKGKLVKPTAHIKNLTDYVRGSIGHDGLTDTPLIFWHGHGHSQPFDTIEKGQVGLHFGTREQAITRNVESGLSGTEATNRIIPLVTNMRKPLRVQDSGTFTGHTIAKAILEVQDGYVHPDNPSFLNTVLDRGSPDAIELKQQIGQLSKSEIKYLEDYVDNQANAGITRFDVLTADKARARSEEIYKAAKPLHVFLRSKGFDGIVYQNSVEGVGDSFIAFDGKNVKHAVANKGTYSSREASVLRQRAWAYGAENKAQLKAQQSNWEQSIKDGDIYRSIGVRNFLGDMAEDALHIRQATDEAREQGIGHDAYYSQFVTGRPVSFVAYHGFADEASFRDAVAGRPFTKKGRSRHNGMFWTGERSVARAYAYKGPNDTIPNQARAIIKMKNPLVLDFEGLNEWDVDRLIETGAATKEQLIKEFPEAFDARGYSIPAWDRLNNLLPEIIANGHDGIIALNIYDVMSNDAALGLDERIPAQYVVPHAYTDSRIATIDTSLDTQPAPRGIGIGTRGGELPYYQVAEGYNAEEPSKWKPIFYSQVEKFVTEKITDKTPVEQLLAILDPAKGTGIAKAELTWIDIASWVDRQKAEGKTKVNKEDLLKYIAENKVTIQEADPSQTKSGGSQYTDEQWRQLQANPQTQEILSSGYAQFTMTAKGFDPQNQENYRVFILRGPKGAVYGVRGHWSDPENIIAHLRTIDVYLDKGTETIPKDAIAGPDAEAKQSINSFNRGFINKYFIGEAGNLQDIPYSSHHRTTRELLRWEFDMLHDTVSDRRGLEGEDRYEIQLKPYEAIHELSTEEIVDTIFRERTNMAGITREEQAAYNVRLIDDRLQKLGEIIQQFAMLNVADINGKISSQYGRVSSPYDDIVKSHFGESMSIKHNGNPENFLFDLMRNVILRSGVDGKDAIKDFIGDFFAQLKNEMALKPKETEATPRYKLLSVQEMQSDTAQDISKTKRSVRTEAEEKRFNELKDSLGYWYEPTTYETQSKLEAPADDLVKEYEALGGKSEYIPVMSEREAKQLGLADSTQTEKQKQDALILEDIQLSSTGLRDHVVNMHTSKEFSRELVRDALTSIINDTGKTDNFTTEMIESLNRLFFATNIRNNPKDISLYNLLISNIMRPAIDEYIKTTYPNSDSIYEGKIRASSFTFEEYKNVLKNATDHLIRVGQNTQKHNHLDIKNLFDVLLEDHTEYKRLFVGEKYEFVDNFIKEFTKDRGVERQGYRGLVKQWVTDVMFEETNSAGNLKNFEKSLKAKQGYLKVPEHPFAKTDQWTRQLVRKAIWTSIQEGYDGISLIPEDLPQKIVGGEEDGQAYYYGKIVPKLFNEELKKFGLQLRYPAGEQARRAAPSTPWEQERAEYWAKNKTTPEHVTTLIETQGSQMLRYVKDVAFGVREAKDARGTPYDKMEWLRGVFDDKNITLEQAQNASEYAYRFDTRGEPKITRDEFYRFSNPEKPKPDLTKIAGSERGLMFLWSEAKKPEQIDIIKRDGFPMYQKAEGYSAEGGEQPKNKGGRPKKPKKTEEEKANEPMPIMPTMPTQGIYSNKFVSGAAIENETPQNRIMRQGFGEHRGFKIVKDKNSGEYKIHDPQGKIVGIPVVYRDRRTGIETVKIEKTTPFPKEAIDFIDQKLGGVVKDKQDIPKEQKDINPAKVDKKTGVPVYAEPARSEPSANELQIVKANVDKTGASKYYMYNLGFNPKTKKYFATDAGGHKVDLLVPSSSQIGPRLVQANETTDFNLLMTKLDKTFDKTKYAKLAPVPHKVTQPEAKPVTAVEPTKPAVMPAKPTEAPSQQAKPVKKANVNTLPPAVAQAVAKPAKATPAKPAKEAKPAKAKKEPKVVMPKEPKPEKAEPIEVMTQQEHLEKQAKALGKGFLEMLRDPELKQYIIDSLNADDNLTLKGTTENANTFDGRFSATRKGKKIMVTQNDYLSPITGIKYDSKPIAYVNNMQQAQMIIRRLEVERMTALKSRGGRSENPLAVMAGVNPAFQSIANFIEIRNNAFVQMLADMREQGIIPVMIDPSTLEPILTILPSEPYIDPTPMMKRQFENRIRGLLPENSTLVSSMALSIIDNASRFETFEMAEVRGYEYGTKIKATRFRNALGYEILKFNEKTFKVFNPYKSSIAATAGLEDAIDEIIKDIHKNGLGPR
jgi:hypothetical protein